METTRDQLEALCQEAQAEIDYHTARLEQYQRQLEEYERAELENQEECE